MANTGYWSCYGSALLSMYVTHVANFVLNALILVLYIFLEQQRVDPSRDGDPRFVLTIIHMVGSVVGIFVFMPQLRRFKEKAACIMYVVVISSDHFFIARLGWLRRNLYE